MSDIPGDATARYVETATTTRGLMVVAVETAPAFTGGTPGVVVSDQDYQGAGRSYDIALDGQHFLFIRDGTGQATDQSGRRINVVTNWFQELTERVPVP